MKKVMVIVFNVLFTSWALFTVYVLIASAWFSLVMFTISPMLVIGASAIGLQYFSVINFGLSVLMAMASLMLIPTLLKGTRFIQYLVSGYFSQMKLIWNS